MLLKRRISGILLLSVILPMVFLAPFHHHDEHGHAGPGRNLTLKLVVPL